VLERYALKPDLVVGSSVGSLVGLLLYLIGRGAGPVSLDRVLGPK